MDDFALQIACYQLARHYFRTDCSDYGYECPASSDERREWPAPMNNWIDKLKLLHPMHRRCPENSLDRDAQGRVQNVVLVDSSSGLLDASAIAAARRFRYRPEVDENDEVFFLRVCDRISRNACQTPNACEITANIIGVF